MLRVHCKRLEKSIRPVVARLSGQTVDEVDADVVKALAARHFHRLLRLTEVMAATNQLEDIVVCRLHSH